MTRTSLPPRPPLLSLDEATEAFSVSAITLVDAVRCDPDRLARLLYGRGRATAFGPVAVAAVTRHRQVLHQVRAAGLGWIIDDHVEGALSYAGVDVAVGRAA